MKLHRAVWAAFPALGFACAALAQETVKLEYKLQPTTELTYKLSGTLKMSAGGQGDLQETLTGVERFVVADVDAATGAMLIGQVQSTTSAMKMAAPQGGQIPDQTTNDVSAGRLDRSGNPVIRKLNDEGKLPPSFFQLTVGKFYRVDLATPLPPAAVAVGATWESITGAPLQGMPDFPAQAKVASTLAEIKTVDGRRCAVIKSKFSPDDKKPAGMPEIAISGDAEILFDIEGGFSRNVKGKLDLRIKLAGGPAVTGKMEMASTLDSMKTLPPEEAAREAKVIRAFDAAAASLYAGEYPKSIEALESLKPADLPGAWKEGVNKAIGSVKEIAQLAKGG